MIATLDQLIDIARQCQVTGDNIEDDEFFESPEKKKFLEADEELFNCRFCGKETVRAKASYVNFCSKKCFKGHKEWRESGLRALEIQLLLRYTDLKQHEIAKLLKCTTTCVSRIKKGVMK